MIVEGPNGIRIEFPENTDQETINRVMTEAYNQSLGTPENKQPSKSGYWGTANEAMDFATGGLMTKGNAAVGSLFDSTINAMQNGDWNFSENYNRLLEEQRQAQRDYNEESPIRSGLGKAAGLALAVTQLPVVGTGVKGGTATGGLYGSVIGAGQDADSLEERAVNTATGALTGGLIGTAGYGLGSLIGAGATKASRAWDALNASPEVRTAVNIRNLANDAGGISSVAQRLDELGPDAMLVDVLGEQGRALGRNISNISPEARETLEAGLLGRKAGQNLRVVSDMERLAGLPQGSTKTVDDLIDASNSGFKPGIDRAYTAARQAGKDLPLEFFEDVLGTPQGKAAFAQARASVVARARLRGTPDDVSNLAIVDEMKKIFDSKAKVAFREGNDAAGGLWSDFARNLRTRADVIMDSMENPIYAEARGLARKSRQAEEAIRLGEALGGSRVARNLPEKVSAVDLGNRQRVAQGYVAKKADSFLNRGSTEAALNELSTPTARAAADAALGPGAIQKTLEREKVFNQAAKALTGNSTTARQLVEMGLGTGVATTLLTGDPWAGGFAGLLGAAARKGAPMIAQKLTTDAQKRAAPLLAEALIGRNLPAIIRNMPPGVLERLSKADRDKLTKALLLSFEQGMRPPQPAPAR